MDIFGNQIQERLRLELELRFPSRESDSNGTWDGARQPIGTSILIKTNSPFCNYLCHTPTMICARAIKKDPNVYIGMTSALYEIYKHNSKCSKLPRLNKYYINSVVLPFLGTGFGQLTFHESAKQMKQAYYFFKSQYPQLF